MLYRFHDCELDDSLYQLRRSGRPISIEPKVFDVLAYLLHSRDHVVTKDELLEKLWPGQVVSETALTRCIVAARKAVGDDGTRQEVIETQHGRGYRFVAPVSERTLERKLAAILHADVQGYSRLMGADEEATLRLLTAYRVSIDTLIDQHRGRVVGSAGDSVLAEFASVLDAVRCAVAIQQELKSKNDSLPVSKQMAFRIGINLGDVMVEGDQIYGDGVNIAARLESLAEAGGICISGTVYDQVKSKLTLPYESLGEQAVKNIAEPVRVYRIRLEKPGNLESEVRGAESTEESPQNRRVGSAHRQWVVAAMAGLLLIVGTLGALRYFSRPAGPPPDSGLQIEATPAALPLPDKPSIIVLPFVNMSGDPGQEYFSDGLTEVLTGDLSQISSLFVIARNSAYTYKGKATKVQEVSKELGVQYVLEGGVLKAGEQVRITVQLIDATTGYHLWSERYDRPLRDLFALQDEITRKIATTLNLQLTLMEQGYLVRKTTDNLEAYDLFLRGLESVNRFTKEANAYARQMFEKAVVLDPQYARAYAGLGLTYFWEWFNQWSRDPQALERAFALAQQAVTLDDSLAIAHVLLSTVYRAQNQYEQARAEAERAISLAPNSAQGYVALGTVLNFTGQAEKAIAVMEQALRLDPHSPIFNHIVLGWAYLLTRRYDEAITTQKKVLSRNRNILDAHLILTISYSESGREEEARAEAAEVLRISPTYSLDAVRQLWHDKYPAGIERVLAALRKAGLK